MGSPSERAVPDPDSARVQRAAVDRHWVYGDEQREAMVEGEEFPATERLVSQPRIEEYAAASGDLNPIHVDPDFAARSRFGTTIAHGMMVAATISELMTQEFRKDWLETGKLKLRFRAPVLSGETITTHGTVKKVRARRHGREFVCSVGVRKQDGQAAITGEATVLVPSER